MTITAIKTQKQKSVRTSQRKGLHISDVRTNSTKTSQKSSLTLAAIVILYIVCNPPRLLLNMMDHFFSALTDVDFCNCNLNPFWFEFFVLVSHLFLVINSAVNFLIYFSVSKMFKKVFLVKLRLMGMSKTRHENDDNDETQVRDLLNSAFIDLDTSASAHIVLDSEVKN